MERSRNSPLTFSRGMGVKVGVEGAGDGRWVAGVAQAVRRRRRPVISKQ
jgi:hypothetical protein